MPGEKKYPQIICFSIFLLSLILPDITHSDSKEKASFLYSLTVETTIINGMVNNSRFYMVPADGEYRIDGFKKAISSGSSEMSSKNPLEDAVNDALSKLTAEKGLKSVKSSQSVIDGRLTDTTIMMHEGVIKYPYKTLILSHKTGHEISVQVEAEFSPYSMPSAWGWQRFKKSVSNGLADMVSVFRQIWD